MGYCIGIDLGGTNCKGALFAPDGTLLIDKRCPTEADGGPAHVLERVAALAKALVQRQGIAAEEVDCIGAGVPGLLDPVSGVSYLSPNFPHWDTVAVTQTLQRLTGRPVYIDNDARINLYGEWKAGAGRGARSMIVLTLGTGLGSGILLNGRVLYGAADSAGEIGHMNVVRAGGRPCNCGSSGCLGRYVSARGMVRTFVEELEAGRESVVTDWVAGDPSRIEAVMLSRAYDEGDALAIEVMHRTGRLLGFALSGVINLLSPERIIVGGGMAAAGERLLGAVRETIEAHALARPRQACRLMTAQLGDASGIYGAAAYARLRMDGDWAHP